MSPFDNYAIKLCMCDTYDEALSTYSDYVKSLGYQSVSYLFIPRMVLDNHLFSKQFSHINANKSRGKSKRAKKTNAKQANIRLFKQYADDDTQQSAEKIKQGYTKTIDLKKEARNKRKPRHAKQEQTAHTMRYEHQLIKGLPIPSLAGNKGIGIAVVSVMSDDDDQFFQQLNAETEEALRISTKLFHQHALSNADEFHDVTEPLLNNLSETEKKVLKALPTSKTVAVIARELDRRPRYIDNVIRELRMKVGGRTSDDNPRISTALLIYYIGLTQLLDRIDCEALDQVSEISD